MKRCVPRAAARRQNRKTRRRYPIPSPAAVPACERTTTIWKTYMKTEIIKISTRRRMNRRKGGKRPSSYFIYFRWAARFLLWKAALTTLAAAMLRSEIAQGVPVQQCDRAAPCPAPARSARIRRKAAPAYFHISGSYDDRSRGRRSCGRPYRAHGHGGRSGHRDHSRGFRPAAP